MQAGELRVGDVLMSRECGEVEVEELTVEEKTVWMFNITVAEVIWHHGGGVVSERGPKDTADRWAAWWKEAGPTFRVRDITDSRTYSNYPNYGIYRTTPDSPGGAF